MDLETTIASQLAEARRLADMSQADLANRLTELGTKTYPTTVAKVEQGERQLKASELLRWAIALNIRPSMLLCPSADDEDLEVFPGRVTDARRVRKFIEGDYPLNASWKGIPAPTPAYFGRVSDGAIAANQVPITIHLRGLTQALSDAVADNDDERADLVLGSLEKHIIQARQDWKDGIHVWPWDQGPE